VGSRRGRR